MKIETASVKVMRSFDYCHFEVCLSLSDPESLEIVNELRKDAARLADKAVKQYQIAKQHASDRLSSVSEKRYLKQEVDQILAKSESDRTPNEMAKVKTLADKSYWDRRESEYDYQDERDEENS